MTFNWQNPSREDAAYMSNLWHTSRTWAAGQPPGKNTPYDRKLWCAQQIAQETGCSDVAAYKALERARIGV